MTTLNLQVVRSAVVSVCDEACNCPLYNEPSVLLTMVDQGYRTQDVQLQMTRVLCKLLCNVKLGEVNKPWDHCQRE